MEDLYFIYRLVLSPIPLTRVFLKPAVKLPLHKLGVLQEICMVEIIGGLPYGGKLKPVPFQSSGS